MIQFNISHIPSSFALELLDQFVTYRYYEQRLTILSKNLAAMISTGLHYSSSSVVILTFYITWVDYTTYNPNRCLSTTIGAFTSFSLYINKDSYKTSYNT